MQWELDVFLTNLRSLDKNTPIVLLFKREDDSVVSHFEGRYPNLEICVYEDSRNMRNYIPTIRPFLVYKYLKEDPSRENETYFQTDSDIIFRKLPFDKYPTLKGKECIGSDCGFYIDSEYLLSCTMGGYIVDKFSEILNISVDKIVETPGIGAQWIYSNPTADLWYHIWQDSQILYDFLEPLDSNIQKWTAEMWAQLYNFAKFGWDIKVAPELSFCRPTDLIEEWEKHSILHNAGVTGPESDGLFYKGKYIDYTPFGEDFSWVDPKKCGRYYTQAINKVYNNIV